ncbi:MAG: stage II sporulation protein P [Lachnospiraceae bacterium]|nr:stage II sporulation protein P [Lachnospiraceae bacterium]
MKKKKLKRGTVYIIALFIIIVWTGILLKDKDSLKENMHDMFINYIVDAGMSNIGVVQLNNKDNGASFQWKIIFEACPFMTYLVENGNDINRKSINGSESLASVYPGYRSRDFFWSGAGSDMAVANRLFENSDIQVAELVQEEKDYNKMLAENEEIKNQPENPDNTNSDNSDENIQNELSGDEGQNAAGEMFISEDNVTEENNAASAAFSPQIKNNLDTINKLKNSKSRSFLLKNFYITDSSTSIDNSVFNVEKLLSKDVTIKKSEEPQILIFHTHAASEAFIDSRKGKQSDTIVGVGSRLAYLLRSKYGYNVIHDTTEFDRINGSIDRSKAYNQAADKLEATLKKYPSIEVVIDLHRDGVGNSVQRLTTIDGKKTAQVMFFNGLSRNSSGNIEYLYNKNLQANLAFSLQLKLKCMENYPDFARPVYLKGYRYNLHMRENSLLIELGNENNTVEEAKNAMEPLAKILDQVLTGK